MFDDPQPGTPEHAAQIAELAIKLARVIPSLVESHCMLSVVTMALVRELRSATGADTETLTAEAMATLRGIGLDTPAIYAAVGRLIGEDGTIDRFDASDAVGLQ